MFLGDKMKGLSGQFIALALLVIFTSGGISWQVQNNSKALSVLIPEVKAIREAQIVVQTKVASHTENILECKLERKELRDGIYANREQISIIHGWKASINQRIKRLDG